MSEAKELCKLRKELKNELKTYMLLVNQPRFVCERCGRAANKKKYLCRPEKIRI